MAGLRMGWDGTSSGNWTLFPHSIPGKGLSAVQPGEVDDQAHFIAISPRFNDKRLKLFNHCYSITDNCNFYQLPLKDKINFILCNYDNHMVSLLTSLYSCRQNII